MNTGDALMQAVVAAPDDNAPRLAYADWLDENGDPERAEFIRVQVQLARGGVKPATANRLRQREALLLREHELRWSESLHGLVRRARFRRGFLECVSVRAAEFLQVADELFRRAPVRHLILIEVDGKLPGLLTSPHLGRAPTLEFRTFGGKIRTLVRSPHVKNLTGLILRFGGLEDEDAVELAKAPALAGLTTLDLYRCSIGPAGVRAMASSSNLAGVRELVLGGNPEGEGDGDTIAEVLAGPDMRMRSLERLHLSYCSITDAGARALAAGPALAGLQSLDLAYNRIGAAGARALAESPHLRSLTHLSLRGNLLGRGAQQALSKRLGDRVRF